MAEPFYSYSRQEAKREGELARWEKSHQANIHCARDIEALIVSHIQKGQLEPDCAKAALDRWGFRRVQFVLANTLISTGGLDFEPDSLRWARSVYIPPDKDNREFRVQAGRALLAQFVQQTHAEYQTLELFGPEHCIGNRHEQDYKGKVLVVSPDALKESCWDPLQPALGR